MDAVTSPSPLISRGSSYNKLAGNNITLLVAATYDVTSMELTDNDSASSQVAKLSRRRYGAYRFV